jgi:hypothetical protein
LWIAKEIVDTGGEATLVRVKDIEGMPYAAVVALFNDARSRDYDELVEPLNLLIKDTKTRKSPRKPFPTNCKGFGVEQIFKGLAKQGLTDHEILSKGFECFNALYAQFKRS